GGPQACPWLQTLAALQTADVQENQDLCQPQLPPAAAQAASPLGLMFTTDPTCRRSPHPCHCQADELVLAIGEGIQGFGFAFRALQKFRTIVIRHKDHDLCIVSGISFECQCVTDNTHITPPTSFHVSFIDGTFGFCAVEFLTPD
ncbi:hypothetical protein JZ751_017743, partial [Albula glossodonta]